MGFGIEKSTFKFKIEQNKDEMDELGIVAYIFIRFQGYDDIDRRYFLHCNEIENKKTA